MNLAKRLDGWPAFEPEWKPSKSSFLRLLAQTQQNLGFNPVFQLSHTDGRLGLKFEKMYSLNLFNHLEISASGNFPVLTISDDALEAVDSKEMSFEMDSDIALYLRIAENLSNL